MPTNKNRRPDTPRLDEGEVEPNYKEMLAAFQQQAARLEDLSQPFLERDFEQLIHTALAIAYSAKDKRSMEIAQMFQSVLDYKNNYFPRYGGELWLEFLDAGVELFEARRGFGNRAQAVIH